MSCRCFNCGISGQDIPYYSILGCSSSHSLEATILQCCCFSKRNKRKRGGGNTVGTLQELPHLPLWSKASCWKQPQLYWPNLCPMKDTSQCIFLNHHEIADIHNLGKEKPLSKAHLFLFQLSNLTSWTYCIFSSWCFFDSQGICFQALTLSCLGFSPYLNNPIIIS